MKKKEFLEIFSDLLQTELKLTGKTILKNIPEWDSLAMIATIGMIDRYFKISVNLDSFFDIKTIDDLIKITNGQVEE